MSFVFLNGKLLEDSNALIFVQDRGFTLGDGIFETLKAEKGEIQFFDEHIKRLEKSSVFFQLSFNFSEEEIKKQCLLLLEKNDLLQKTVVLRVTLTRGISARGIDISEHGDSTLLVTGSLYHLEQPPVRLMTSKISRSSFSMCSRHKTLNYLANIMARGDAKNNGFDDALFLNEKNETVCATTANIFFKKNGELYTPPLSCGAIGGVMRAHVINEYRKKKFFVHEKIIMRNEIKNYDQCFITNSLIGIRPVKSIDEVCFVIDELKCRV